MQVMQRRCFFQIIAGALIAPALPPVALGSSVPRLWADGVHDDGGDLVVFQMGKADCRWIKERRK